MRYAVVGLGHIAQNAILPAFARARRSQLVALVSGDEKKLRQLGKKYGVDKRCSYEDYDELLESGEVDAVFIALPNSLHKDYTVRAAQRGVHVLCEKPLAMTEKECQAMIDAARANDVRLMTAYRLHFNPANLDAMARIHDGEIGDPRTFLSSFSYQVKEENIRLDGALGGGALRDIGIYCLNASRYLFRDEPIAVFAMMNSFDPLGKERFAEVDGTVHVMLRFPDERVAMFSASFAVEATAYFEVLGSRGRLRLDPAYEYAEPLGMEISIGGKTRKKKYADTDQFAAELEYFSNCVLTEKEPEPGGMEGLADTRIITAIEKSATTGRYLELKPVREPSPEKRQKRSISKASSRPALVRARSAS
ncbi:MAG: Gfo/Idh/MocA family oxidoreductase [Deltaproteobacteria bacterium]|nr:Gfo/Idh/MocA family oxidoreductase [Deltaproteobacteria bacterium]